MQQNNLDAQLKSTAAVKALAINFYKMEQAQSRTEQAQSKTEQALKQAQSRTSPFANPYYVPVAIKTPKVIATPEIRIPKAFMKRGQSIGYFLDSLDANVESIDVCGMDIKYIPNSISRFTKLKILDCSHNYDIQTIPFHLISNTIIMINCSYCNIRVLPNTLEYLFPNLGYFNCSNNKINVYPNFPESLTWFFPSLYNYEEAFENESFERYPRLERLMLECKGGDLKPIQLMMYYIKSQNYFYEHPLMF